MPDKKARFGQKAPEQQRPDPHEFIFGKAGNEEAKPTPPPPGGEGHGERSLDQPTADEPMVRITVDVRKSIHKQLQRVCNERDLKLAPFIRQLIDRELAKLEESQ
jgi:hypothetical protein